MIVEDMKVDDLECAAQKLIDTYTNDLGCELREELVQFARLVEDKSKSKPFYFIEMFHKKDIVDTFPNVEIMLKIYLSMMVTFCSGEGSFSKVKLI